MAGIIPSSDAWDRVRDCVKAYESKVVRDPNNHPAKRIVSTDMPDTGNDYLVMTCVGGVWAARPVQFT